jgi:hypothetical protein
MRKDTAKLQELREHAKAHIKVMVHMRLFIQHMSCCVEFTAKCIRSLGLVVLPTKRDLKILAFCVDISTLLHFPVFGSLRRRLPLTLITAGVNNRFNFSSLEMQCCHTLHPHTSHLVTVAPPTYHLQTFFPCPHFLAPRDDGTRDRTWVSSERSRCFTSFIGSALACVQTRARIRTLGIHTHKHIYIYIYIYIYCNKFAVSISQWKFITLKAQYTTVEYSSQHF